jgi:hypothetical protein
MSDYLSIIFFLAYIALFIVVLLVSSGFLQIKTPVSFNELKHSLFSFKWKDQER